MSEKTLTKGLYKIIHNIPDCEHCTLKEEYCFASCDYCGDTKRQTDKILNLFLSYAQEQGWGKIVENTRFNEMNRQNITETHFQPITKEDL